MVVALKKSDLYSSLWKSADELRGGMATFRNTSDITIPLGI